MLQLVHKFDRNCDCINCGTERLEMLKAAYETVSEHLEDDIDAVFALGIIHEYLFPERGRMPNAL